MTNNRMKQATLLQRTGAIRVIALIGFAVMTQPIEASNPLLESFRSENYTIQELGYEIDPENLSNVRLRIKVDDVIESLDKIENIPPSLLIRINDLQGTHQDTSYFEELISIHADHETIKGPWSDKIKIVDYKKEYTDNDLNSYLGLDDLPVYWVGIATYQALLEKGEIAFNAYATKNIYKIFNAYTHRALRGIFKFGDLYILSIHDPFRQQESSGNYLIYPRDYATIQYSPRTGNIFGMSVKTHKHLPVALEQIVVTDSAEENRAVYLPKQASSQSTHKPASGSHHLKERINTYWSETNFGGQYLSFTPAKLYISWYSLREDKYYSDEIPLFPFEMTPHIVSNKAGVGYFPQFGINIFPQGKVSVHANDTYQTFVKFNEGTLTQEKKEEYLRGSADKMANDIQPDLIKQLDRQFKFYTWMIEYSRDAYYMQCKVHDGSTLPCAANEYTRSPLPQSINLITQLSDYQLYIDVFELESQLSRHLANGKDKFILHLDFDRESESFHMAIVIDGKKIPFDSIQVEKLK